MNSKEFMELLLAILGVLLLAAWVYGNKRDLRLAHASEQIHQEIHAALLGLCLTIMIMVVIAAVLPLLPVVGSSSIDAAMKGLLINLSISVGFLSYMGLQPAETSVWQHQRLRHIRYIVALMLGFGVYALTASPYFVSLCFAAVIYHRHRQGMMRTLATWMDDAEGLTRKLLTLEAERVIQSEFNILWRIL